MMRDDAKWTFDCEPTLTDTQVLEFCREGYLLLRGVVPEEINRRTCDYLEGKLPSNPSFIPAGMAVADLERIRGTHEPSGIFLEDWFLEHVLLHPQLTGAMRSLLGRNVGLPVLASHHAIECPQPAQAWQNAPSCWIALPICNALRRPLRILPCPWLSWVWVPLDPARVCWLPALARSSITVISGRRAPLPDSGPLPCCGKRSRSCAERLPGRVRPAAAGPVGAPALRDRYPGS